MAVLTEVDRSGDEGLIDAVFARWGYHCFHSRRQLEAFAQQQALDFRGYLEYVNSGRARFWQRLEYDERQGLLKVTGRQIDEAILLGGERCSTTLRLLGKS
jgi:hypothetical protein